MQMTSDLSFRWSRWFVGLVFGGTLLIMFGCGSRTVQGPRITSKANLHRIGTAIRDYADDHGSRPQKLSDLVPRYIPLDQIGMFYVTNNDAQNPSVPTDWASNSSRIGRFSSYVYLGTNSVKDILAFERPNLWKPSAAHSLEVSVLFSDYHVQYIQRVKLQELISKNAPIEK